MASLHHFRALWRFDPERNTVGTFFQPSPVSRRPL
jgi:hypothetical protein